MKIELPAKELAYALTGLMKVISPNASLPVLRGVRIQALNNTVTLTGTDLDCFVTYTCQSAVALEDGCTVIADTKRLKAIVQNAKSEIATIRTLNPDTCEVGLNGPEGDRVHVLATIGSGEWPSFVPDAIKTAPVDPLFLQHYRMLLPFSSTDSSRHTLEGVCCEVAEDGHLMIATDGRRLTTANSLTLPINRTVIIPRNKFLAWPKLQGDTGIGLDASPDWIKLSCGTWTATMRLISGTYPNWRQVIPCYREKATRFALAEEDVPVLLDALKTLPGGDQASKPVALITGTPHPRIAACDPESGVWSYQVLARSFWEGDVAGIIVNRDYLADSVKAGFRNFEFLDDISPLLTRSNGNTHVLMPVRATLPPEMAETRSRRTNQDHPAQEPEADPIVKPNRKEITPMIQPKQNGRSDDQQPDLWTQYQTVKEKVRELNSAITELGQSIKGFHKDQKTVRVELDNARGVLAKLQSINI